MIRGGTTVSTPGKPVPPQNTAPPISGQEFFTNQGLPVPSDPVSAIPAELRYKLCKVCGMKNPNPTFPMEFHECVPLSEKAELQAAGFTNFDLPDAGPQQTGPEPKILATVPVATLHPQSVYREIAPVLPTIPPITLDTVGDTRPDISPSTRKRCCFAWPPFVWLCVLTLTIFLDAVICVRKADLGIKREDKIQLFVITIGLCLAWTITAFVTLRSTPDVFDSDGGAAKIKYEPRCEKSTRMIVGSTFGILFGIIWIGTLLCGSHCYAVYFPVLMSAVNAVVGLVGVTHATVDVAKAVPRGAYQAAGNGESDTL